MSEAYAVSGNPTPLLLHEPDPDALDRVVAVLRSGGLISFPTDTVYALAAALDHPAALQAIYAAKGRSLTKAIPVLLSSTAEVNQVATPLPPRIHRFIESLWPGPLTVVVPARDDLPAAVTVASPGGGRTVAMRVPDHDLARSLIERAGGAVAATSANLSGQPPATTARAAVRQLGSRLQAVLDGGPAPGGVASTIISMTAEGPSILRSGDLTAADLERRWEESANGHDEPSSPPA